jgi:hypothetical protein
LLVYGKSKAVRASVDQLPGGVDLKDVWSRMKSWFQGNF